MAEVPFTVIDDGAPREVTASVEDGNVRLTPDALHAALGWELKPQGLCKDDACIPVRDPGMLDVDGRIALRSVAALLDRPFAVEADEGVAALGASAGARAAQLRSLEAPDFTLPDLHGTEHSLSDFRGKKVLLIAYASW